MISTVLFFAIPSAYGLTDPASSQWSVELTLFFPDRPVQTVREMYRFAVDRACKQVIGRRMKQTGARWRVRRANRMATLCCTLHGDTWKP